jgi:hypothetical protein
MTNIGRRLRRGTQALALAAALAGGTVALASAQPAFAATSGTTGYLSPATCGWHVVDGPGGVQYKVTTASLPYVTGPYSTSQLVWLHVEFMHPQNGVWQTYRDGWFYTYARSGVWSTSWSSQATGRSGYKTVDDVPGANESGYADPNSANPYTGVKVTAYWYSGSLLVGASNEPETNPSDAIYGQYVCNGGPSYA